MSLTQYYTATTLDGFIADPDNSLDWLFTRRREEDGLLNYGEFIAGVGAMAMGSTTYEWLLEHEFTGKDPAEWKWPYDIPCWVFTHRQLPAVPDSRVEFTSADIAAVHNEMVGAAGGRNVWVVGGGDLAGQFADVGCSTRSSCRLRPSRWVRGRLCCPAGSNCDLTNWGGTATSPPPSSPSFARAPDARHRTVPAPVSAKRASAFTSDRS